MPDVVQQHGQVSYRFLRDGFDQRLEPIAFICPVATDQLSAQAHFAVLPQLLLNFEFNLPTREEQPYTVELP